MWAILSDWRGPAQSAERHKTHQTHQTHVDVPCSPVKPGRMANGPAALPRKGADPV